MRHFDHGAGMPLIAKIDKTAPRAVALLTPQCSRRLRRVGVSRHSSLASSTNAAYLHARGKEVAIHAGRVATLLDQSKLNVS